MRENKIVKVTLNPITLILFKNEINKRKGSKVVRKVAIILLTIN